MMNRSLVRLGGLLLLLACLPAARAVEVLRWDRLPLAVPLVVGQERVIFLERNVRVGVPADVADRLRVQSAGGAIYLRASDTIAPTRLQLQDAATGALILVDVAAAPAQANQAPLEPIRIVEAAAPQADAGPAPGEAAAVPGAPAPPARHTPAPVILTRYAAQNLYAPLRTVEPAAGIERANARTSALQTLLPVQPIRAKVLGAWRLEDLWVTAVRLTNTSPRWLELDPRELQGDFVAATFQHPTLGPAGDATDTTAVYLVTRGRGLDGALLPAIAPIDPALSAAEGGHGHAK